MTQSLHTFQSNKPNAQGRSYSARNTDSSPVGIGRFAREISLFIGLVGVVWWILTLGTYSKNDAAWTTSGDGSALHNFCGATGALAADLSYFLFGLSAWWLLLAGTWFGWHLFAYKSRYTDTDDSDAEVPQFNIKAFAWGLLLLLCASTTLEWSWLSRMEERLPNHSGGILGYLIGSWSVNLLGFSVIGLLAIVLILVGMALVFHFSWLELSERLGAGLEYILQTAWQRLEQIRDRQLGQKAMREREFSMYEERVAVQPTNPPTNPPASLKSTKDSTKDIFSQDMLARDIFSKDLFSKDNFSNDEFSKNPFAEDTFSHSSNSSMEGEEYPTWEEVEIKTTIQEMPEVVPEPIFIYVPPSLDLLNQQPIPDNGMDSDTLAATARLIEKRLGDLGVRATVQNPQTGPVITCYEVVLTTDIINPDESKESHENGHQDANDSSNINNNINKDTNWFNLAKDLARSLSVNSLRLVNANPGKGSMVLELPNAKRQTIGLAKVLDTDTYREVESPLAIPLGQDTIGNPIVVDLAKMPHLLMAGSSGSGQSVGIHSMICTLLLKADVSEIRLLLIDPKMHKLSIYEGLPHLITPIVTDMKQAINSLSWCVVEMDYRYKLMSKLGVSNFVEFNQKLAQAQRRGEFFYSPENSKKPMEHLPSIVIVVNELADLMLIDSKKAEMLIARLAQKARAAGIHLVLATKNPNPNVMTGLIKINIPARIAFQVNSKIDSHIILDANGAEALLGMGDMLYLPNGAKTAVRVHGTYVSDEEILAIVDHIKQQYPEPRYIEGVLETLEPCLEESNIGIEDPLYEKAVIYLVNKRIISAPELERQFKINHHRATELLVEMEKSGIVSAMGQAGKRDVITSSFGLIENIHKYDN